MDSKSMGPVSPANPKMAPIFEATFNLRWLKVGQKKTLQQQYYARNTGESKWVEIPTVKEELENEAPK